MAVNNVALFLRRLAHRRTGVPSSHQQAAPERVGETAAWNLCEGSSPGASSSGWVLQQMMKACPHQSAPFWCEQIDACKHAARVGHKVRCGWESYGMTATKSACIVATFATLFYLDTTASLCSALSVLCSMSALHTAPLCQRAALHALSSCASGRPSKSPGGTLGSP